jgi:hypothetical protein
MLLLLTTGGLTNRQRGRFTPAGVTAINVKLKKIPPPGSLTPVVSLPPASVSPVVQVHFELYSKYLCDFMRRKKLMTG